MVTTGVLTVCAVLAGLGAILLLAALIPRRIDDHPLCAKCGFDLIGLHELNQCPECGRQGLHRIPVVIGHRRRRTSLLWPAVPLLVVGLAGLSTIVTVQNVQTLKPFWWLKAEAASPSWGTHWTAMKELERRITLGKLTSVQVDELVNITMDRLSIDPNTAYTVGYLINSGATSTEGRASGMARVLKLHSDRSAFWPRPLGMLIGEEFRTGGMSQEEFAAFVEQSMALEWRAPMVEGGEPVLFGCSRGADGGVVSGLASPSLLWKGGDGRSPLSLEGNEVVAGPGPLVEHSPGSLGALSVTFDPGLMSQASFMIGGGGLMGRTTPTAAPVVIARVPISLFQPPSLSLDPPTSRTEQLWRRRLRPLRVAQGDSMGRSVSIVVLVPRPEGVETDNIRVDVQKDGVRTTIADGVIKFQKDGMMISVFGGEVWGGVGGRLRVPPDEELPLNLPWSVIDRPRLDFIFHVERDKSASDPAGEDFPPFEVVIPGVLVRPDPTPPRSP